VIFFLAIGIRHSFPSSRSVRQVFADAPLWPAVALSLGRGLRVEGIEAACCNPFFSFMIFVDKGDFSWGEIVEHYLSTPASELPNVVCILNEGIIVNSRLNRKDREWLSFNAYPEFNQVENEEESDRWSKMSLGSDSERAGYSLASFFFLLSGHLAYCRLMPPNMQDYLNCVFLDIPNTCEIAGQP
jgi:hypothetical protein